MISRKSSFGRNLALSFAVGCLFISCAGLPSRKSPSGAKPVYLTNSVRYVFLPPSAMEGSIDELQQLTGSYGEKNFSFLVYTKAGAERTEMLVLNDFGTEMARLEYSAQGLNVTGLAATAGLSAEYIMADFQLVYYSASLIEAQLVRAGLRFVERSGSDRIVREVYDGDALIIRIERDSTGVDFRNILRGYSYSIRKGQSDE